MRGERPCRSHRSSFRPSSRKVRRRESAIASTASWCRSCTRGSMDGPAGPRERRFSARRAFEAFLSVRVRAMKGAFKRVVAGMPIFLTEAQGPGEIAFSRDGAGHLFPLHLMPGKAVLGAEHQV